jgi:hypothetical protein
MCIYCGRSTALPDELFCLCAKRGVVAYDFHCMSYQYDPLKRIPKRLPRPKFNLTSGDFDINK